MQKEGRRTAQEGSGRHRREEEDAANRLDIREQQETVCPTEGEWVPPDNATRVTSTGPESRQSESERDR